MDIQKILEKSDDLFNKGQAAEAVSYLETVLGQAKSEGDWQCELTVSNELMGYYRSLSKFETAWEHAVTAVEIITKYALDETLAGVTTFLNIANIYRAQGDIEQAMDLYRRVEEIYKKEGLTSDYRLGGLYNNMSVASLEAGNREDALRYGEAAAEVLAEIPNTADERATVFSNMATVLLQSPKPDFERVEFYLDRSLRIFEKECPNSAHVCGALSTKAYVTYLKGDMEGALTEYEKAMAETKKYYGENVDYKRLVENYEKIRGQMGHDAK
jgi:tetratricopeptide (TPR) repeat protein